MRIIAFIDDPTEVKKILTHLGEPTAAPTGILAGRRYGAAGLVAPTIWSSPSRSSNSISASRGRGGFPAVRRVRLCLRFARRQATRVLRASGRKWMAGFAKAAEIPVAIQWQFLVDDDRKPRETRGIVVEFPILSNTETDSEISAFAAGGAGDRLLAVTHPLPAVQLSWTGSFQQGSTHSPVLIFPGSRANWQHLQKHNLVATGKKRPRDHAKS